MMNSYYEKGKRKKGEGKERKRKGKRQFAAAKLK